MELGVDLCEAGDGLAGLGDGVHEGEVAAAVVGLVDEAEGGADEGAEDGDFVGEGAGVLAFVSGEVEGGDGGGVAAGFDGVAVAGLAAAFAVGELLFEGDAFFFGGDFGMDAGEGFGHFFIEGGASCGHGFS